MYSDYFLGLSILASVIIGIGPQSLFVIEDGIISKGATCHKLIVPTCCFVLDVLLITLSITIIAPQIGQFIWLGNLLTYLAIVYLAFLAVSAFLKLINDESFFLSIEDQGSKVITKIRKTLLVSLLNPFTYTDTVFILGVASLSSSIQSKFAFTIGALTTSLLWFTFLATFAYFLSIAVNNYKKLIRALNLIVILSCIYSIQCIL